MTTDFVRVLKQMILKTVSNTAAYYFVYLAI